MARARGATGWRALTLPETEDLVRKLFIVAVIRVSVVTFALAALFVVSQIQPPKESLEIPSWQFVLIGTAYALSLIYAVALYYRRWIVPLAHAQIVLDSLIVSYLVLMTGGIESVFAFAYLFTVLGGSMTLYEIGAVSACICSLLMLGTVLGLQIDGSLAVLPRVSAVQAVFSFFMHAMAFSLAAWLSSALAEKLRAAGRRLAERESDLEELQALHAAILASLPAGVMTVDRDGIVGYANEAALSILRAAPEALVGHDLSEAVPPMFEHWKDRRDANFRHVVRERMEEDFVRLDGSAMRVGFSFAPLGREAGGRSASIVVFQDVTDLVRLKEAVERAERLATVGKFAAGLAHEVRNPLASMCASIDVLRASLSPPEPMQKLMGNVVKEADRLNALITDFLSFARPRALELQTVDLGVLVGGVVAMFEHDALASACTLESRVEPGLLVTGDEALLRQVVWNLARNAAEAARVEHGRVTIEARAAEGDRLLVVRDTGPGIPRDKLTRIFDPFYTTKRGGTGLGLAITHSIVEAHGAELSIESEVGRGTEVIVRFPASGALIHTMGRPAGAMDPDGMDASTG